MVASGGKSSEFQLPDGRPTTVRYNEGHVQFPIVSVNESTGQGNWFVFGPGVQVMAGGSAGAGLTRALADIPHSRVSQRPRGLLARL